MKIIIVILNKYRRKSNNDLESLILKKCKSNMSNYKYYKIKTKGK